MSGANCYYCYYERRTSSPVGVCDRCSLMICPKHGSYDLGGPKFICSPGCGDLLLACAVKVLSYKIEQLPDQHQFIIMRFMSNNHLDPGLKLFESEWRESENEWTIRNTDDFAARFPQHEALVRFFDEQRVHMPEPQFDLDKWSESDLLTALIELYSSGSDQSDEADKDYLRLIETAAGLIKSSRLNRFEFWRIGAEHLRILSESLMIEVPSFDSAELE